MTKPKAIEVTVTLKLEYADQVMLLQNAIERLMNNAIKVGKKFDSRSEDASILWQDCEEVKPLLTKIWWATQEAVRQARS